MHSRQKMTNQYSEQGTIDALDKMLAFFTGRDKNSRFSKERLIKFPLKMSFSQEEQNLPPSLGLLFFSLFFL